MKLKFQEHKRYRLNIFSDGKRMKITAVHYEGDSSRLVESRHHSYQGEEEGSERGSLNEANN